MRVCNASCSSSASRRSGQRFLAHFGNCRRVEAAHLGKNRFGQHAAHFDGAGSALLERRVIEVRERIRVQNFVRELRWHGRIHSDATNAAVAEFSRRTSFRPSMSIASVSASFITSLHKRMLRNSQSRHRDSQDRPQHRGKQRPANHRHACAESVARLSCRPEIAKALARERRPNASEPRKSER